MTCKLTSEEIHEAVRNKYSEVAHSVEGKFKYPTGKAGAEALGYDLSIVQIPSETLLRSFCGVGNPFKLGKIHPGETVLDIGCGAGFDLINAAHLVGSAGRGFGIDLTPDMVERARKNITGSNLSNAKVKLAGSESIPFDDDTFDVIISNGALNLSPLKEKTFREIYRVLKPDGRFQFADIILKEGIPVKAACNLDDWTG